MPIADNEISFRVPRTNERRPDPRYTTNLVISNDAQSWYDGAAGRVDATLLAAGCGSRPATPGACRRTPPRRRPSSAPGDSNQLGPDSKYARGYARFHTPHRFTFNGSYRLPFWRDRPGRGGCGARRLDRVGDRAAGAWHAVHDQRHRARFELRRLLGSQADPARRVDSRRDGRRSRDTSTPTLARDKFRTAQFGEIADLIARNTFFGDGQATADLGLYKTFRLVTGHSVTVRFEAFNAFNKVQYGFPTADLSNVNFGRILGGAASYAPRSLQLGVRCKF